MPTKSWFLGVAAVAAVTLSACSGDADPAPSPSPTPVVTPTEAPTPSTSPEPSEEPGDLDNTPTGEYTEPGAVLGYGEWAVIEWYPGYDERQSIAFTVDGYRTGTLEDFADFDQDFQDQLVGYTPVYFDITVEKRGPEVRDLAYSSFSGNINGLDQNGNRLQGITIFGSFEICDASSFDPSIDEGEPQTLCVIAAVREGQEVGGAEFTNFDTEYASYGGEPIIFQ